MSKSGSNHIKTAHSYISEKVKSIPHSGIRKFFDLIASMEGVISLGVGEPDFVTPWHIREAAIYSLEKGYTMYTSNKGMPELSEELAKYLNSQTCPDCVGTRLRKEARHVKVGKKNIQG